MGALVLLALIFAVIFGIGALEMDVVSIAQSAKNAGFTGDNLIIAVAVALAESGGNANAEGDYGIPSSSPGRYNSFGLWQINVAENPKYAGWNLLDPDVNAQAAFEIFSTQGWNAWSTYKSQKYLVYAVQAGGAVLRAEV